MLIRTMLSVRKPKQRPGLVLGPMLALMSDVGTFTALPGPLALASGNPVGLWKDQSGYGNDVQNTGTACPAWVPNVQNGRPALQFDGSSDWLVNASPKGFGGQTGLTIVAVLGRTAATSFGMNVVTKDGENEFRWDGTGTFPEFIVTSSATTVNWFSSSGVHVYAVRFDDASNAMGISADGAAEFASSAAGTFTSNCLSIGGRSGGAYFVAANFFEVYTYSRRLSDGELSWLVNDLRIRYRV